MAGRVGELEHGWKDAGGRRDVDARAVEDEARLDMPWRAAGLCDGVAEVAQVLVRLELRAKLVIEGE
jgi:hypothetical protein